MVDSLLGWFGLVCFALLENNTVLSSGSFQLVAFSKNDNLTDRKCRKKLKRSELQISFYQKLCTLSTVFYSFIFLRKCNLGRI